MTKIDTPLSVAISLDIDPDANSAVEGRHDALSSPIEYGEIRVDACKNGLQKILGLLEKYDIDATLFYEARTAQMLIEGGMDLPKLSERHEIACHSLKHEDFLGKVSGIPMEEKSIEESIDKAKEILVKMFGREIKGFRAPYTRINRTVVKVLERLGFQYDSSETAILGTEWTGKPYLLEAFDSSLLGFCLVVSNEPPVEAEVFFFFFFYFFFKCRYCGIISSATPRREYNHSVYLVFPGKHLGNLNAPLKRAVIMAGDKFLCQALVRFLWIKFVPVNVICFFKDDLYPLFFF